MTAHPTIGPTPERLAKAGDRPSVKAKPIALRWVIVICYGQAEWQVHTSLLAQGIRSFLPYTLGSSRRGRWAHGIVRPQYPGYLFVAMDGAATTEKIKRTAGVYEFLRSGSNLVFLSHTQIASLKAKWLVDYRDKAPKLKSTVKPKPGDWLVVPNGPLAGVPCQVDTIDKSGHIAATVGSLQVTFHVSEARASSVRGSAKPEKNR